MTGEYEKRINQIKESLDKAKNMRIRAEARLEELNKQKEEILRELKELNVSPDQLDDEISKLKSEIEELMERAQNLIPQDLIK
ncbi:hypothetical protein [Acetivibrio clariflavus]|uniref:Uncharacterized protein n=1 Tax=Acetivibrio clariflavus (strain DSM 19732 / NBRC 101661 / EBR45) TaxID=720554 RepID=G8LZ18_ACECE|nr:hypothetical protein [Acetivibrio clariflavus]AEV68962.1 hypothetical protein Clocl_2385 [Acetivibrio clariflavus DSM 19732]HOQ00714.1 hypothetical protein [Acetivibrio clariflavus]